MLTCRNVSENASELLDHEVTGLAHLALRLHLFICVHCRRYVRQLGLASKAAARLDDDWKQGQPTEQDIEALIRKLKNA
ncbi:MAG: zf-HC2 domain-containing protein [Proteobacteria bacterium]|jgi:predicted anti-sigma-YlaC factor YlaD|nr:zf-HC2 domain-containing protein [Pseudomonadota bacterium]